MINLGVYTSDGWCEGSGGSKTSHLVTPSRKGVTPRCDALKPAWIRALRRLRHTVAPISEYVYVCACAGAPAREGCFHSDLFKLKRFDGVTDRLFMRVSRRHTQRRTLT